MMDVDPPLDPERFDRTGPELREALRQLVLEQAPEIYDEVEVILEEMKRRSPKYQIARARDPDPDPETILRIRAYKEANPAVSHKEMSQIFDTSTRCISLALVGKRDGSQVFDETGRRIRARRMGSPPDEDDDKPDWMD